MPGATVTIADLPPEVLLRIFAVCQSIWPAGWFNHLQAVTDLGWVSITHVCRWWRDVLIANPASWANYVTAFYSLEPITVFLSRAKDVPPVIDLDLLDYHYGTREERPLVLAFLTESALWSTASCIISHATSERRRRQGFSVHRGYTPKITSLLSQPLFRSLQKLDVFLPSHLGQLQPFEAPLLSTLVIRSSSTKRHPCPLSLKTLDTILLQCPALKILGLHDVVDTTVEEVIRQPESHRALDELKLSSDSEELIALVLPRVKLGPQSTMDFELCESVSSSTARDILQTFCQWEALATYTVRVACREDPFETRTSHGVVHPQLYYEVEVEVDTDWLPNTTVSYRLDEDGPTWTWRALSEALPVEAVSVLVLQYAEEVPSVDFAALHAPESFFGRLLGLQSITINRPSHVKLLKHIPNACGLRQVAISVDSRSDNTVFADVWDWLVGRHNARNVGTGRAAGDGMEAITIVLTGSVNRPARRIKYYEAPTISEIRRLCVLEDRRAVPRRPVRRGA